MAGRRCPGFPSGTICDNEGQVHVSPNGYVKKKDGSTVPRIKYERFCPKHRKEDMKLKRLQRKKRISGLRPTQQGTVKKQSKRIRDLEQKLESAQTDLADYAVRSRRMGSKNRRLSSEYISTVSTLRAEQRHMEDQHAKERNNLLSSISFLSTTLDQSVERNKLRLQRHVDALALAKT